MTARQDIVNILVEDKLGQLLNEADFARHVLTNGFPGFSQMSASQLRAMVCDAGLEMRDGMGLLLHELSQQEPIFAPGSRPAEVGLALPIAGADPRLALATEIRRYFQNEATPVMVKVMLETLGPLADTVRAEDDFKALDELTAAQLRRLVPISFALRDSVRTLIAAIEEQA